MSIDLSRFSDLTIGQGTVWGLEAGTCRPVRLGPVGCAQHLALVADLAVRSAKAEMSDEEIIAAYLHNRG